MLVSKETCSWRSCAGLTAQCLLVAPVQHSRIRCPTCTRTSSLDGPESHFDNARRKTATSEGDSLLREHFYTGFSRVHSLLDVNTYKPGILSMMLSEESPPASSKKTELPAAARLALGALRQQSSARPARLDLTYASEPPPGPEPTIT
jgi:hypothetical protein